MFSQVICVLSLRCDMEAMEDSQTEAWDLSVLAVKSNGKNCITNKMDEFIDALWGDG